MISDNIIKQTFIIDALKDAASSVFLFQLNAFHKSRKPRTGATIEALSSPQFMIASNGSNFIVSANVTKQLRLQDLGFRSLYTRPLFGALKHTYGRLQYGLTDDIRAGITEKLEMALNQS